VPLMEDCEETKTLLTSRLRMTSRLVSDEKIATIENVSPFLVRKEGGERFQTLKPHRF
jgi:hypothetical protein